MMCVLIFLCRGLEQPMELLPLMLCEATYSKEECQMKGSSNGCEVWRQVARVCGAQCTPGAAASARGEIK